MGTNSEGGLPLRTEYGDLVEAIKREVRGARLQAARVVNAELARLYWRIGRLILDRGSEQGWGSNVIGQLAVDLRREFPSMKGLSRSSLFYMRKLAASWPESAIVQQPAGQLPWGHLMVLLDRLNDQTDRDWYAARAVEAGWSRKVLEHHIATGLHLRLGAGTSNFAAQLAPADSDLAREMVKDPYVFDFLDLGDRQAERDIEQALMNRLQDTLLEFGRGFAFVGRQVRFDIDGDEFFVDLLLFNVEQNRYVVVELKVGRFRHEYAGQLGFYVTMVDDELRRPALHGPTVGILLCAGRNERVVRYALRAAAAPMAVATYTYDALPSDEQASLPDVEALTAALLPDGTVQSEPRPGQTPDQ